MFDNLTESNYLLFAIKIYDNPGCSSEKEFIDDFRKIKSVEKHFKKYKKSGKIKERLVLNHIITIFNIFGPNIVRILFLKIDKKYWDILKSFLIYLNYLPDVITGINSLNIDTTKICSDVRINKILLGI